jgi:hypothetical protein
VSDAPLAEDTPEEAQAPRPRRMLLLLVVAFVAIIALVWVVSAVVRPGIEQQTAADKMAVNTRGFERVGWAGGGQYAIIQDFERDGTPIVVAWNRETGKTQVQRGWVWVRTEQAAPAIWLVPLDANAVRRLVSQRRSYPLEDTEGYDQPAPGLVRWALDSASAPAPAVSWAPIPSGEGVSAELEVDSSKGSAPYRLRFRQADGTSKPAEDPSGRTFDSLGWSASGDFFAARPLLQPSPSGTERVLEFYTPGGTNVRGAGTSPTIGPQSWAGSGSFFVDAVESPAPSSKPVPVFAQDIGNPLAPATRLLDVPPDGSAPVLLGPAGSWVLIRTTAARKATQYDEITAPGRRERVFLVPRDPSAEWTHDAWQDGAGLLRLGVSVSALGEAKTRVLLFRQGVSRPKTIYRGPKRLTIRGK